MKTVVILFALTTVLFAKAPDCKQYIAACEDTIKTEDASILHLKQEVKSLEGEVQKEQSRTSPLIYIIVGLTGGLLAGKIIK